jgi:pimeloyl-ACP methyl ester carboxylesterase
VGAGRLTEAVVQPPQGLENVGVKFDEVRFDAGEIRLAGTVSAPDGHVETPGVVLVGGSGPTGRSNDGYFDVLRDGLAGAGVTVLAFDKRGVGGSTGVWATAGVEDLASDAIAALAALRAQPGVDPRAVGFFGHSEGGWVALRACASGAAARHLILNSCPAVSFFEAEVHALTVAGVPAAGARAVFERLREMVRGDTDFAMAAHLIADAKDPLLRDVLDQSDFRLTTESWAQLQAWIDYTPAADLDRLGTPTLAIYGANDPLTPVETSVDVLARRAAAVHTQVFADADHRLYVGGALAKGYLDTVTSWCASTAPPARSEL